MNVIKKLNVRAILLGAILKVKHALCAHGVVAIETLDLRKTMARRLTKGSIEDMITLRRSKGECIVTIVRELITMLTPKRIYEEELLDAGEGTDEDVARSLIDLRRVNRFFGGRKVVLRAISSCLDGTNSEHVSVLDVGTGSADLPMAVAETCRLRGMATFIAAVDLSERNLRVSRSQLGVSSDVHLVRADSLRLPFAARSFDFVTASLFLHHFRDDDVVRLLADFGRIARRAVIVNDLVRNLVPYYFTRVAGPILAWSFLTRNDGPVSVLRGFTSQEMNDLARRAGLRVREMKRVFPYRLSMVAEVRSQ